MIGLTVAALAELIGCERAPTADGAARVESVEFDTRKLRARSLFVALTGERVDGHDFAVAAEQAGAVAVLGSRDIAGRLPLLRVADNAAVLAALALIAHRSVTELVERHGLVVVGVTGSSGKTSTKDLIAAVLRAQVGDEHVVAPPESFNNELGHPYTVLRADPATRYLVLEMSARGPGHIASLAATAPPRIGAVLNVGTAHLGEFGSVAAIAQSKGELVEALPPAAQGGVAILNADDPRVLEMATRTRAAVVTVGTAPGAQVRATDIALDDRARARFTLLTPEGSAAVALRVAGGPQVGNALTAAAVGRAAGMSVTEIAGVLSAATPASKWRMEITERPDGVTVINDAYNANPDSMKAALRSLATIGERRRTWAVLGEMAELGAAARDAHDEIGRLAVRLGVDRLIAVGERTRALYLGAHLEGSWSGESELVPDIAAAVATVLADLAPGDVVLVKASRSAGLEKVAQALLAADSASTTGAGAEPTGSAP